jgi:hypothetical protein
MRGSGSQHHRQRKQRRNRQNLCHGHYPFAAAPAGSLRSASRHAGARCGYEAAASLLQCTSLECTLPDFETQCRGYGGSRRTRGRRRQARSDSPAATRGLAVRR